MKRMRQDAKRHARNLRRKHTIKVQIKSFMTAVHDQKLDAAQEAFSKTCSVLDKIACTGAIHRNTAARRKSRLSRHLAALQKKAK